MGMVPTIEEEEEQQQQQLEGSSQYRAGVVGGREQLKGSCLGSRVTQQPAVGATTAAERRLRQPPQEAARALPAAATTGLSQTEASGGGGGGSRTQQNYLSSLITKSSILLQTLKQQYSTAASRSSSPSRSMQPAQSSSSSNSSINNNNSQQPTLVQQEATIATSEISHHNQKSKPNNYNLQRSSDDAASQCHGGGFTTSAASEEEPQPQQHKNQLSSQQVKPPLPPPPPHREALRAVASMSFGAPGGLGGSSSVAVPGSPMANARRHAIQEQSLERDAALSLKARDLKHKRTSSIKSALRHANLGSLRASHGASESTGSGIGRRWLESSDSSKPGGGGSSGSLKVKSMPYELFEPPVTQRTFQRSKRRGAMLDPKRQMSADTIALRQLTDEYLKNAGVKPMSSSGQCSLVALIPVAGAGGGGSGSGGCQSGVVSGSGISASSANLIGSGGGPGGGGNVGVAGSSGNGDANGSSGQCQFTAIETQFYQASKRALAGCHWTGSSGTEGSVDSLSTVTIFPGNLPWQSDVSVQCELLQAPQPLSQQDPPYETTGDILNTIAGPFRGSNMMGSSEVSGGGANQLSATLRRGLTAISQHHLTPSAVMGAPATASAALNVVGNLKKSLSNTLDISRASAHHLHSQDSLPAYSNLLNEPDESLDDDQPDQASNTTTSVGQEMCGGGLIGQLASKLGRQSSKKKFSVSRKGLQRALSFDCRGYKRLEAQQQQQNNQQQGNRPQLLSASSHQQSHNRSTLCLDVDRGLPRPYLPQSASQVDFQLPLLPYHKMQEAIVSQRLIGPANESTPVVSSSTDEPRRGPQPDADELLCGGQQPPVSRGSALIGPQETQQQQQLIEQVQGERDRGRQEQDASLGPGSSPRNSAHKIAPPRLVLDIPTIDAPTSGQEPGGTQTNYRQQSRPMEDDDDDGGEEVCAVDQNEDNKAAVIVYPPSPNMAFDPGFSVIPNSTSFCIDPNNQQLTVGGNQQLTANDIFSNSKSLIKRPSTMLVSDTMNQVAMALNNTGTQEQVSVVLRNRRQAIVPPKLATDGSTSDGEQAVGQLVDVDDEPSEAKDHDKLATCDQQEQLDAEEATVRALRRKRSGGGAGETRAPATTATTTSNTGRRLSGSQVALPTFCIEQEPSCAEGPTFSLARQTPEDWRRPDSQATNADSIVSSGSSTNLSMAGRRGDFTVTSPGGLTVSFGSSRGRRRSSIAVIPQMQICPGDLLVYSKQLIDRMNQSDETEPPQFLTIDDKKAKNIWSSFKLFDNRTLKARNELLCSLEDVLASLQPSTFVDEQLSHYKGMLWNEFLYETESRRSASSEVLSMGVADDGDEDGDEQHKPLVRINGSANTTGSESQHQELAVLGCSASVNTTTNINNTTSNARESLKATMSSGPAAQASPAHRSRDPGVRSLSSRFREKPKLKRGQTVDSVFRIPLIPSSPLKHAQQHQQTPTAHLEEHALNEDDERSLASAASGLLGPNAPDDASPPMAEANRKSRSCSNRSRAGSSADAAGSSRRLLSAGGDPSKTEAAELRQQQVVMSARGYHDSSFETDDAMDLIVGPTAHQHPSSARAGHRTPHQIVRQSSLSTLSSTMTRTEQKRQRALWDLFQSECTFFFDHLLTLKNVYMEPLKKIQVEGFAMFADPDVLFGNLDELCCGVYDFCKEFLYIIMRTLKTRPEELNATDVLIKLYKKNPKIDHLRGVYHRYTLNYINALTYLESLRRQVEFVEFEKWSSRDVRCKKLQLTDLLVAPVQHIMRVPIILKDIESHTENPRDREEIRAILAVEEASLRELDDKMRWLKNFERLLEIQKNISWPSVIEQDSKLFIPDFLKEVLSKQPCEKLIVSPRRQIVHEGTLSNLDLGKACDMHVILFDDMLLLTRRKKGLTKKASTVCKTNSGGGSSIRDDGSFKYIVYKQPLSLDRFYVHDVQQVDAQSIGLKHLFLLIIMNRFQQITNVHSFSAPNDDIKIKKTAERWKKNFSNSSAEQQEVQHVQQTATTGATSGQHQASGQSEPNASTQDSASGQQQSHHQYQPLVPKVVQSSTASRQMNTAANQEPPPTRRPLESPAPSPSRLGGAKQQTQSQGPSSLSNPYPVVATTTTSPSKSIERTGSHQVDIGRDSRQRHYQYHHHHQQSIELVVTSASAGSNSHGSSTNVSSLAPAH